MWCLVEERMEKVLIVLLFPRGGYYFQINIFKSFNLISKGKQIIHKLRPTLSRLAQQCSPKIISTETKFVEDD